MFDCAMENRRFYLPRHGEMGLQFFHVQDLCRMIDAILEQKPENHVFNVGNENTISIYEWVKLCYKVVGTPFKTVDVNGDIEQRDYFSFYNYEYKLDISRQKQLLADTMDLEEGLWEAFAWYKNHKTEVNVKDYLHYIDEHLANL